MNQAKQCAIRTANANTKMMNTRTKAMLWKREGLDLRSLANGAGAGFELLFGVGGGSSGGDVRAEVVS